MYETTTWGQMYSPSLDLLALKFQPVYLYKNCDTHPSKCQRILPLILRKAEPSREVIMLDVDWRVDIIDYILNEKLPSNKTEAERVAKRSKGYVLVGSKLYKQGSYY